MRDQGSYNMSEARISPDYSFKKCIYWMLIALLTCVFIAICVIASIGLQKNSKSKYEPLINDNNNFLSQKHPARDIIKQTTTTKPIVYIPKPTRTYKKDESQQYFQARPYTTDENQKPTTKATRLQYVNEEDRRKSYQSFEEEVKQEIERHLNQKTSEEIESKKTTAKEPEYSSKVVDVRIDQQPSTRENYKEIESQNHQTTTLNELIEESSIYQKIYKKENYQEIGNTPKDQQTTAFNEIIERSIVYQVIREKEPTTTNDIHESNATNEVRETTTEFYKENPLTVTSKIEDKPKKTSMTSRGEEFTSTSTERIQHNATKLDETTTEFIQTTHETSTEFKGNTTLVEIEKECPIPVKVCETNSCKKSASKMLALMDHSADPCNDFYQFSCGGMKINQMEETVDENYLGIDFDALPDDDNSYLGKFKIYYQSCINFDPGHPFNPNTTIILTNRLFEGLTGASEFVDLTDVIANIILSHPHGSSSPLMPMFDVIMDIGPEGKYIPVITLPLEVSDIFEADAGDIYEQSCKKDAEKLAKTEESAEKIYGNYMACFQEPGRYIQNLNEAIAKLEFFSDIPDIEKRASMRTDVTFNIEMDIVPELGFITAQEEEKLKELRSTYSNNTKYYGLDELQSKYPKIYWERLFKKLFPLRDSVTFSSVKVLFPKYLDTIFAIIKNKIEGKKFEDLKSILRAMVAHDMYIHYLKPHPVCNREKYCKKLTTKVMGDIATNIYLKKINKKDYSHKEEVASKLFDKIRTEYKTVISKTSWLTNLEKEEFTNKVQSLKLITNGNFLQEEDARLQERYSNSALMGCFITNNRLLKELKRKTMYAKLDVNADDPINLWSFLIEPLRSQPITLTPINTIVLPFSVLNNLVGKKRESLQDYENYSKLGFMLSREIASFFNPTNKNNTSAKNNEDYNNFVSLILSDPQVSKMENRLDLKLDSKKMYLTRDSRFSDDSALRLSYETYSKNDFKNDQQFLWMNYSIPKLFYLSVAQQFCSSEPNRGLTGIDFYEKEVLSDYFRVNSFVMNSEHFSDVFECAKGSSMNPEVKVDQFPYIAKSHVEYVV